MASLKWRQNGGSAWVKDPCFCYTPRIDHPEDVLSEDEPVFQDDQEDWVGFRVDRTDFPEDHSSKHLGMYYFYFRVE